MQRTSFSLLFYIKRTKLLRGNLAPVYCKITINGECCEFSLKRGIEPNLWDTKRNHAKGNSIETKELNDYITSIRGQLFNYHRKIQETGLPVTALALKNAFLGIDEKKWTLIELFQEHNDNVKKLIGKDFALGTYNRFLNTINHLSKYLQHQFKTKDIFLTAIDHKFISGFEFYLKSIANVQHNTAMKNMLTLKKIVRIGLGNGYLKSDPFFNYKITHKKVNRECLTESELKCIMEKNFAIKRLEIIRDLFLVQCFTGLAWKDLASLTTDHIQIHIEGEKWIFINRHKTNTPCYIPVLPIVQRIIEKYKHDPECIIKNKLLPVPSNQRMNGYLKEIADICGVRKNIQTHLGRYYFVNVVALSNGIPIDTIQNLVGHTKISTTQTYMKTNLTKISNDVNAIIPRLAVAH